MDGYAQSGTGLEEAQDLGLEPCLLDKMYP